MSSYLRIISSLEEIPTDLTGLEMIEWVLYRVDKTEFGSCSKNEVYLNLSDLSNEMYDEFTYTVDRLTRSEFRGSSVVIPSAIMQSLWNKHTLIIQHQRLGPLNKEKWLEFCKTVQFYVYVR